MAERTAVIVGASGGLGAALADMLESREDFTTVIRMSRTSELAIDICDEDSIVNAANALADRGLSPDLVVIATGILHRQGKGPEKSLRDLDACWMVENYRINAVGPLLVAKHFLPLMPKDRRICFAALSARVSSISDNRLGGWHSYRASKAALNMLISNLAIEWHRKNPQAVIVGLHPGTVETPLSEPFRGSPATERFPPAQAAAQLLNVLEAINPEQSGQLFSFDGTSIAP